MQQLKSPRMTRKLDNLLLLIKHSTHKDRQLGQVLAYSITSALIHVTLTLNCMIRAYTNKSASPVKAILIYNYFTQATSFLPDNHTYSSLLHASTLLSSLPKGKEIHARVIKTGFDSDIYISNKLIHFYGSLSQLTDARRCFDQMSLRDLITWNSILSTYSTTPDRRLDSLVLFKEMMCSGVGADEITLVILLSASTHMGMTGYAKAIHSYLVKVGIQCGIELGNALLHMYTKSGQMDAPSRVLGEMVGRKDTVSYTILLNGYVELGLVDEARQTFDQMVVKDLAAWNSMINGYVKVERFLEAMKLFGNMEIEADETTIVCLLSACASLPNLRLGRSVHQYILRRNIKQDVFVGTSLINMYSKCGSIDEAMIAFSKMDYKDAFTWTAMITGLADYGNGEEALTMFEEMENERMKPNEATFISVLMACSRSGLVEEGCLLFDRMVRLYKIKPTTEHLSCLIDLLSKAGLLRQAESFIGNLPFEERLVGYKILLSASMSYSDIYLGDRIAEQLLKLSPQTNEVYILLSNFYALAGWWNKVTEMRSITRGLDMRNKAGTSCLEV